MQLLARRVGLDDEVVPFVLKPVWKSTSESGYSPRDTLDRVERAAPHADHEIEGRLKSDFLTVWNIASIAGSDVAESGLGRWARSQATGSRSSGFNSSPVTGHRFSEAWSAFSIKRRSNKCPVFLLTTGCWGISPEMAQYIFLAFGFLFNRWARCSLALLAQAARDLLVVPLGAGSDRGARLGDAAYTLTVIK